MKAYKLLFLIVLAVFLADPALVNPQDLDPLLLDDQDQLLAALGLDEVAGDDNLINLTVTLDDAGAGIVSGYAIDFDITQSVFELLKNGGLKFAFPAGFNLYQIQTIGITDNYEPLDLGVESFRIADQLLTVNLQQARLDDGIVVDVEYVHVTISINSIGNPSQAGDYQLATVAFKQNNAIVAGPTFSNVFTIYANNVVSISVTPSGDFTLKAGEIQQFSAEGFDQLGNKLEGLVFSWSLNCDDCIGFFEDSTLYATTTGQARAVAIVGDAIGYSGLITVESGDLDRMDLAISDIQFVGYPFRGTARIALYDAYDNPKTDYSLSAEPISLVTSDGTLTPAVLSDDNLIADGVIDIIPVGVVYSGFSADAAIFTDNGQVASNSVQVSFNAYDILDALDFDGQTVSRVFAGQATAVWVVVQNSGNIRSSEDVVITAKLNSATDPTVTTFSPGPVGSADTIEILLPVVAEGVEEDVLTLTADAKFTLNSVSYTTQSLAEYAVDVLEADEFTVVEGSFRPDTILGGLPFDISFDVFVGSFYGQIDSTYLAVQLVSASGGGVLTTLYEGYPEHSSFHGGIISYDGLTAILNDASVPVDTWHPVRLDYRIYSSGNLFTLQDNLPDSMFVLPPIELTEDVSSLMPTTVSANSDAAFRFEVNLANTFSLGYAVERSSFTVTGTGFSTTTSMSLATQVIEPGANEFVTERMYIPASQLGGELTIQAVIGYTVPGIPDEMTFVTDFEGMLIPVTALPVIQIQSVDVLAPNAPMVNTDQPFQVSVVVANISETPANSLQLRLSSDGGSIFDSEPPTIVLAGNDTTEVIWDITAGPAANSAEIFVADVLPDGISILPPVDNVALVTIETPAELNLTYSVFGAENGLIDYGNDFNLTVELINSGAAQVTDAEYLLVTEGLDADGPDSLAGRISVSRHIDFSFVAPQRDTTIRLEFTLTNVPLDINTALRADIGDTSFAITIRVIAAEASLLFKVTPLGTNLVLPGRAKELVQFDLTNTGISSVAVMQLERIVLFVHDPNGNPLDVMSIFDIGNTGFYEDGQLVSQLTAGNDLMAFSFDQFIINPQQTRSLILTVQFKVTSVPSVVLELAQDGVVAHFTEGPNAGLAPAIISDGEEGEPLLVQALAVKQASLTGSFIAETNPFNPDDPSVSPLHLTYELPENAAVEFRIFTLTGEEVYSRDFEAGANGGTSGENVIEWDGCNNEGYVVLNGVYVALVHNTVTGEMARLKIAVVK